MLLVFATDWLFVRPLANLNRLVDCCQIDLTMFEGFDGGHFFLKARPAHRRILGFTAFLCFWQSMNVASSVLVQAGRQAEKY